MKLDKEKIKQNKTLMEICKIGQIEKTCKYLGLSCCDEPFFECLKLNKKAKAEIDKMTDMYAKGDNCEGIVGKLG